MTEPPEEEGIELFSRIAVMQKHLLASLVMDFYTSETEFWHFQKPGEIEWCHHAYDFPGTAPITGSQAVKTPQAIQVAPYG